MTQRPRVPRLAGALALLLTVSGTAHFVVPDTFTEMVPSALPHPRLLQYAAGLTELGCAAGLLHPRTRRAAGWAAAALLVAVFPGNIQMAVDAGDAGTTERLLTYARLPLQVPLVVWAVAVARRAERPRSLV